jgi:hypothetical protein
MRLYELIEDLNVYYHGSMTYLSAGTILKPSENYETMWGNTDFYSLLEKYRPIGMLSHKEAVFMVADDDDIDLSGGGTNWVFIVEPLGKVQKHDINWSSEISMISSEYSGTPEFDEKIYNAALNYWNGIPHYDESVWEYLTPGARIISVEEY